MSSVARRPVSGPRVARTYRLPVALLVRVEERAELSGMSRTLFLERALEAALGGGPRIEVDDRDVDATPPLIRSWVKDAEIVARFWEKVARLGDDACWEWLAGKRRGYGRFTPRYPHGIPAHRFAYELLVGPIAQGMVSDHVCRNKGCVNPAHIDIVTNRENVLRGEGVTAQLARQTHCKRGHELVGDNLLQTTDGSRQCKECKRIRRQELERAVPLDPAVARAAAFRAASGRREV